MIPRFAAAALISVLMFSTFAFASQLDILIVSGASTNPVTIYPGDLVTVTFNVQNISGTGQPANEVVPSLILNSNDFTPVKVSEELGTIGSRSFKAVSLRFQVNPDVLPGIYNIPVSISYLNGSTPLVHNGEITLDLSACKTLKIDTIMLSSQTPHIGESLEVVASVSNPCQNFARDVKVELKPVTNATIAPFIVPEGTVKKIGDINPGASRDVSFLLSLSDRVTAQAYVFLLDANCDGCKTNSTNQFSFLALGEPDLVFSNIEYSVENVLGGSDKQIMQGSPFTLSIQLDNIGEEKAKGVEVSVDFGDGIEGSSKSFLGNIDPDDSGAAVFSLLAAYDAKPGDNPGTIAVSYTDELGERQVIEEDYSLFIHEQPPTSPVVYIILLAFILAVVGAVYFVAKFIFRQLAIRKAQQSR